MRTISGRFGAVARVTALMGMVLAAAITAPAQTFTTLHSFDNTDGNSPDAGLVQATNGNLYGTTFAGGANGNGTIFKITPSGTLTTLYSFCSQSGCADGAAPETPVVQAIDGNLYGTTRGGGANGYYGTVFKVTPGGTLTTLYSSCSQSGCTDGQYPAAGLVQATDGTFYGTTQVGGFHGAGTIFKITPSGALTTLYSFCSQSGCTDGAQPYAALLQGIDGNFYGTTVAGGGNGVGAVVRISPRGTLTTLHSFDNTDGSTPYAALIQASDGNFYGTTNSGGVSGRGTVFKVTSGGTLTTLYSFASEFGDTDGENPGAALVQATDGSFYGTTVAGGANGVGTMFKITPSGTLTSLYSFCSQTNCPDGEYPWAALVQDTNGILYGTSAGGGTSGPSYGTVFSLSGGLGPFVETQPTFGKAGKVIKILGTNLTGATSVTFNGVAATFKVISRSLIGATIPTGATAGPVEVVTPSGTLTSNVNFQVLP